MTSRLPACETCRTAKLACDHKRPVCTRCRNTNRADMCIYRTSPFKRKRSNALSPIVEQSTNLRSPDQSSYPSPRWNAYPNPGYLGSSSHAAIFSHISLDGDRGADDAFLATSYPLSDGGNLTRQGADALRQLLGAFSLKAITNLVSFWLAKGVNLALAGPFVDECAQTMNQLLSTLSDENWHLVHARHLLQNSAQPLQFDRTSSLVSFSAQFLHQNARWETLGIFFSAVSRATIDVSFFPSLYSTEKEQYALRSLATKLSDHALEIAMSLDCLNDLQLMFQYENFIVHSYVDGDQSYHSWRRLGDVIASTFALGYHENIALKPDLPPFLIELRQIACARIYSADKNVAIFLGRPPRMSKRFCHFQLFSNLTGSDSGTSEAIVDGFGRCEDAKASYRTETRWSALCASLKEEIMEMFYDGKSDTNIQRANVIQDKADILWEALPPGLRLEGSLKQFSRDPFERDFVASARLNYLHVLFLLHHRLLSTPAEPNMSLIEVAQQMLSLVVETILLRDQLVNSGTGLVWRVAYYGLPAAGFILLAMLQQREIPTTTRISWTKTLQNLTVFIAEIEAGTIIKPGDPNYALLSKATQTIRRFLDSVQSEVTPHRGNDDWTAFLSQDFSDFELPFWQNLGDQPSLDSLPNL